MGLDYEELNAEFSDHKIKSLMDENARLINAQEQWLADYHAMKDERDAALAKNAELQQVIASSRQDVKDNFEIKQLKEQYEKLLDITRTAMGYLVSLNGDLNYDSINEVVERYNQHTGEDF